MLLHSLYAWPACSTCVCVCHDVCVCVVYRVAWHAIKTKLVGLWAAKDFDFGQLEPLAGGAGLRGECSFLFSSFLIELFSSKSFN